MKTHVPWSAILALFFIACGSAGSSSDDSDIPGQGPAPDTSDLPPEVAQTYAFLRAEIQSSKEMTPEGFAEKYRVGFRDSLGHSPLDATNLDLIQGSELALGEVELGQLEAEGFVISEKHAHGTFFHAYETIYREDLPVFVSADSILDAIHRSYDRILLEVEDSALIPELLRLLGNMRNRLGATGPAAMGGQTARDLDLYLAVAYGLLTGTEAQPVAGADADTINKFLALAYEARGMEELDFLGVMRKMDFSQFEPRGHYTDRPDLGLYFRCMIWLGRVDFRLVETQEDGERVLNRGQVRAAIALRDLMDEADLQAWQRINGVIEAFVGESDNMQLDQIEALLGDLGISDLSGLEGLSDEAIQQTILQGGYGTQRIASHIMVNGLMTGTLPLNSSFLLFGQRYVVDSHVFSNLVYDRVGGGEVRRMMPDPLDVAFAALGNDQAAELLAEEIARYQYAPDLHMMRVLVDQYDEDFWGANLYNLWLGSIRALSPAADKVDTEGKGLPSTMGSEAWGRRVLNTQLGSWSQLRHDTLLYAKQSYTGWPACEFPDAYVDPYPEFYAAVVALAEKGKGVAGLIEARDSYLASRVREYFAHLSAVAGMLGEMAEQQLERVPFSEEQLAFINDAVVMSSVDMVCAMVDVPAGWYPQLFFEADDSSKYDPVIADVHTQPADEAGNEVGRILHVATGEPRMMVVTIETSTGPYAYVGPVFSYFEVVGENWERYTDEQWAARVSEATPEDVPWMIDLVVR
jgi:hypothetical protein